MQSIRLKSMIATNYSVILSTVQHAAVSISNTYNQVTNTLTNNSGR